MLVTVNVPTGEAKRGPRLGTWPISQVQKTIPTYLPLRHRAEAPA